MVAVEYLELVREHRIQQGNMKLMEKEKLELQEQHTKTLADNKKQLDKVKQAEWKLKKETMKVNTLTKEARILVNDRN